jgi:predicted esterase
MPRPVTVLLASAVLAASLSAAEDIAPIARRVPPPGKELPAETRTRLEADLAGLEARLAKAGTGPELADVRVFAKAVGFALRQNEIFDPKKDVPKVEWALQQAKERLDQLAAAPWTKQAGLVPRGYVSAIDGSVQPYGLVIPEKLDLSKPVPLYIWLHGRGETTTDLPFLWDRAHSAGEVHPDDAIVVHPFGRQCVGFKEAGEVDVLDVVAEVQRHYRIDPERIVLMGFSMGGGGSKQIAAHYTDHFCAIHTGAGFAETARFTHLKPENYPPAYEQTLWGVYDVPCYVRNLFNVPFSCYSGEKDGQIQAAQVLEEAFKEHGHTLVHLIGPGAAHFYNPETLKQALAMVHEAVVAGRPRDPASLTFQTRTLRYHRMFWLDATALDQHWKDTRIDATAKDAAVELKTVNLAGVRVRWPGLADGGTVTIDGQAVKVAKAGPDGAALVKDAGAWRLATAADAAGLRKSAGLQGPIDDAFTAPFLVVEPSGQSPNPRFQRWASFEARHFHERWSTIMRGELRTKKDSEVTDDDLQRYHLVLWGDAASNSVIARLAAKLPIRWDAKAITVGSRSFDAAGNALAMIYPNPLNPAKYVVLNSALTFREANDRNNAMQNPKLPDWAVIDLAKDPDENAPGGIAATDFFDERWQLK